MNTIQTTPGDTLFYAGARDHVVLFIVVTAFTSRSAGDPNWLRSDGALIQAFSESVHHSEVLCRHCETALSA